MGGSHDVVLGDGERAGCVMGARREGKLELLCAGRILYLGPQCERALAPAPASCTVHGPIKQFVRSPLAGNETHVQ